MGQDGDKSVPLPDTFPLEDPFPAEEPLTVPAEPDREKVAGRDLE